MKKTCTLLIVIILLISSSPLILGNNQTKNQISINEDEINVHLLKVEHYLYLKAKKDTTEFTVKYAFPRDYQYQTPIYMQVHEDTHPDVIDFKIENDTLEPNKFANFTISSIKKDETKLIHFSAWVLVENQDYEDLPGYTNFPSRDLLPEETTTWLTATEVTQKDNFLIKTRAKLLAGFSKNMIDYAKKIAPFIKDHRYLFFVLQLKLGILLSQDAVTTLLINGENVGRSHLASALLRNKGIPARVLLALNDQGFWTQMHYMIEYYVPGYDWVLLDTTRGKTPFPTSRQVINRVCHPEDENNTKTDYIFKLMKGEERWIFISTENVEPYYVDCREGSKSQMFKEKEIDICESVGYESFNITRITFNNYQQYSATNLNPINQGYYENATKYQKQAIDSLTDNGNILDYYFYMRLAKLEYEKISM